MLQHHHTVILEIGYIHPVVFPGLFRDHPENMCMQQTLLDSIWVLICVSISMVGSMFSNPEFDRTLHRSCTKCC